MKISIVTISYNQASYLEAAIESVLSQKGDDLEYIVVDPGSTDGSRDIIERYRDRLDRVILEPDNGPADGLNKGFEAASGDYFGFLNADDLLLPTAIRGVTAALDRYGCPDVVYGHADVVNAEGRVVNHFYSRRFSLRRLVAGASVIAQQSTFFSSQAFRRAGGFNAANRIAWDGELWIDLALTGAEFRRVNEFWSQFRIYDTSITGSGQHRQAYRQWMNQMFEKVTGHPRRPVDRGFDALCKVYEYVSHPRVLATYLRHGRTIAVR